MNGLQLVGWALPTTVKVLQDMKTQRCTAILSFKVIGTTDHEFPIQMVGDAHPTSVVGVRIRSGVHLRPRMNGTELAGMQGVHIYLQLDTLFPQTIGIVMAYKSNL
jgi:hypothetical protein